jgi:tetratricopeptide (TPR) repeat protein
LHPLHVESVAWIAERKDVLSAFFWFLTLWLYAGYARQPSRTRYALTLAAFCLGLMAKPMLVTLPFVLLLLDVWPLHRWPHIWEKAPFFGASAAASIATYLAQSGSGAVQAFPLGLRIENAVVSYGVYIVKMFWPVRLAVFYPYPATVPIWQAALAVLAILAVSAAVVRWYRSYPYLAIGWFWFLGVLVPVIGLVQVGGQARADRYMYIPMTGLSIMLAWGAVDLIRRKQSIAVLGAAACLACMPVTWAQAEHWANSQTLFQHALDVTDDNYLAYHNLGVALATVPERLPDAIADYRAALAIKPDSPRVHTDLGSALAKLPGRLPEAIAEYREALRIEPNSAIPHNNLGNALSETPGSIPEAIQEYEAALRIKPNYAEAHNGLGSALAKMDHWPEAAEQFEEALRIEPDYAEGRANLGRALGEIPARLPEAIAQSQAALRANPNDAQAHSSLGSALAQSGRLDEAIAEYQAALRLDPESADAHFNLGVALAKVEGRTAEAIDQLDAALRIKPNFAEAHNNLGVILVRMPGKQRDALGHFEEAVRISPGYADAQYNLGAALADIPGRMPEAIHHFEVALQIKPDPELKALVEKLRAGKR